jgi:VWFA-related protein
MCTRSYGGASRMRIPAALALAVLAAAVPLLGQSGTTAAAQQGTQFRTGVNFVRVDVYPTTKEGQHVGDLASADFEVLEDGVRQRISTFEHVTVQRGVYTPVVERIEPGSTQEEQQAAMAPRGRLFVIFLDQAHVSDPTQPYRDPATPPDDVPNPLGPPAKRITLEIDKALTAFLDRMLGPDDLVAVMTQWMQPGQITFVRRPDSIEEFLRTSWAERSSAHTSDPEEMRFARCPWPPETFLKRREERTLSAARRLVRYLDGLREERKSVLLVTEGWMLFARNNSAPRKGPLVLPDPPGVYVGRDGKVHVGTDRIDGRANLWDCDAEAARLSQLDSQASLRDLIDEASRANTAFYPIDPRGLAASDPSSVPLGRDPGLDLYREALLQEGFTPEQVDRMSTVLQGQAALDVRLGGLKTLANSTGGIMNTSNDLTSVVQRIADDLSSYYLIGYSSTNTKTDGTYRRITVRVKREGVQVRARKGYYVPTSEELAAARERADAVDPEADAVREALVPLSGLRDDLPFLSEAGGDARPGPARRRTRCGQPGN